MCTLTIIPEKDSLIFTFNRDENPERLAFPPKLFSFNGINYIAPIDAQSQGTWLAISDTGLVLFLMNGGFIKHSRKSSYKHSRGLIIPMIFEHVGAYTFLKEYNLSNIEPFTMLIYDNGDLIHFVWDGTEQFWIKLSVKQKHIFSSSTLYDPEFKLKRRMWFENSVSNNPGDISENILKLHATSFLHNGLKFPGNNKVQTVSTTQIKINQSGAMCSYFDLQTNENCKQKIEWKRIMH